MKSVRPVIATNGTSYLQMRSVESKSTSRREKEEKKQGRAKVIRFSSPVAMSCGRKSFKLVWRCHQLQSGFLAKGHVIQQYFFP